MAIGWHGLGPPNIEVNYVGSIYWYVYWHVAAMKEPIEMIHMKHTIVSHRVSMALMKNDNKGESTPSL